MRHAAVNKTIKRVGLLTKPNVDRVADTLVQVYAFLQQRKIKVVMDEAAAAYLTKRDNNLEVFATDQIGAHCDLVIIIGGDGSLLKAARAVVDHCVPLLGINRGNLGFLADLRATDLALELGEILDGEYYSENRGMLNAQIISNNEGKSSVSTHLALNDVVLHHGEIARLIEFEIYIDDRFVVKQRADGIIISSPTGSTAYALSGGGPIIYPTLQVMTLMPMFPHALNTRPLVIDKFSKIRLVLNSSNKLDAKFSCDGQTHMTLLPGDEVHIQSNKNDLLLLHPKTYNYFTVLREKLGWNREPV